MHAALRAPAFPFVELANALALHLEAAYVTADRGFWQQADGRDDLHARVILLSDLR